MPQHRELFEPRPQQNQPWEQLRERLRARLGDTAVHSLSAQADHRPECAWCLDNAARSAPLTPAALRPGWLLAEPQALPGVGVQLLTRAERIESGWWDGGDVRRDYYRVQTTTGLYAWAYRNLGEDGPLWLQGWFA
ncbi:hypothetical protein D3C72_2086470 [compost metagenome]